MTHAELRDLLGLHALGALEADDAVALEAHLGGCRACRKDIRGLEEAAAELARGAGPVAPSAGVTHRILEAARSEPRRASPRRRGVPRRGWRLLPVAARIAVAAVVVVLAISHVSLLRRLDRAAHMLARGRELVEFIASPDVTTMALAATDSMPGARAFVAYDRRSGRVVLFAFNLPPPSADHVYQLWLIGDGVRPGAVFSPDALGGTLIHDRWSPERRQAPLFAITLEPSPGVREPTGEILLLGGSPRPRPDAER